MTDKRCATILPVFVATTSRTIIPAFLIAVAPVGVPRAQAPEDAGETSGFEAFRVLINRNIFDSERRPDQPAPPPRETPKPPPPAEVVEAMLLGTLVQGMRRIAFVREGEDGALRAVEPETTLAGFRISDIDTRAVRLTRQGADIMLPVGQALVSRPAEQDNARTWVVKAFDARSAGTPSRSSSTIDSETEVDSDSEKSSDSDTEGNDILKRLMERRKKELQ